MAPARASLGKGGEHGRGLRRRTSWACHSLIIYLDRLIAQGLLDAQGELLALLFLHPDQEYSLSEIARQVGVSLPTVHAEVGRLALARLVSERRLGQARLVRANGEHVLTRPLTEILELTYGPLAVLPDVLAGLPGLRRAFVYGSWAARRLGEPGGAPRDIDVVVVGTTPRTRLEEASQEAARRLHREVNITRISPAVWAAGQDPFVRTLTSRPLVEIHPTGDGHDDQEGDPAQ